MCANQTNLDRLTVRDVFTLCDLRVCEFDKMQDVGNLLNEGWELLPIFDYSHKYVGILEPVEFVKFLGKYFENLKFCDRGNEFVFDCDDESSGIHFVPIDQISRYVKREVPAVSLHAPLATAKQIILENEVNAIPVADENEKIVGTISMRQILAVHTCPGAEQCHEQNPNNSALI